MPEGSGGPVSGQVFRYPFLWKRQKEAGETEGRKTRPTCLAVTTATAKGETLLFLLPITTQPPMKGRLALEVTPMEARRAGLETDKRCWVMLDEINTDILERSWLFEDRTPLGAFSPAFADAVRRALLAAAKAGRAGIVNRQD
ncbi:MAG: hypothetical protein ACU0CO_02805 [Shimia sp.]